MPQKSIQSQLRETFSSPDKEVWKQFASQELDGKSPDDALSWNTEDQLRFSAYYDSSDEKKLTLSKDFRITVADDPYFGAAKWLNTPFITVTSEKTGNQTALQYLTHGADGIFFDARKKINLEFLLNGIDWRYCSLFFTVGDPENFPADLKNYIFKNNLSSKKLSGGLFWESVPNFAKARAVDLLGLKNILTIKSSTPVQQIAQALSLGVQFYEESNNHTAEFFKTIGFSIQLQNSFLESIAKLKALRFLWFQIAHAYHYSDFLVSDLFLHARSEPWVDEKFQPHGNMLRSTTAGMAAIIGGANALTIFPEDFSQSMMNRIACNVSNLLREESHLDKVADPAAGAYAIDIMTEEFAKQAWTIFQKNQSR